MLDWLWSADGTILLAAFGFIMALASLIYARNQAKGAHAQVESARKQAAEALLAAELVAKGAREQAVEALRAAALVAENARLQASEAVRAAQLVAKGAREQAAEALRAAGLVAENARLQAVQALRAAELLASSAVSARVREMRARTLLHNADLPLPVRTMMNDAGGPEAYGVLLDSIDIAQEIYTLRTDGVVSDQHWKLWMNDQMVLIAGSKSFQPVFRHAASQGVLNSRFVRAFEPALLGRQIQDPYDGGQLERRKRLVTRLAVKNGTPPE